MLRPTRDEMLIQVAMVVAQRSTCSRAHVGAVVAREGRILVTGYNGAPSGMDHCDHSRDNEDIVDGDGNIIIQKTTVSEGCRISVHAESNCVAYAARFGIDLSDSTIYTTLTPCLSCAQLIINAGVLRVVCLRRYRDRIGVDLLLERGLEVDILGGDE